MFQIVVKFESPSSFSAKYEANDDMKGELTPLLSLASYGLLEASKDFKRCEDKKLTSPCIIIKYPLLPFSPSADYYFLGDLVQITWGNLSYPMGQLYMMSEFFRANTFFAWGNLGQLGNAIVQAIAAMLQGKQAGPASPTLYIAGHHWPPPNMKMN